jgi:hypothetical protein
LSEITDRDIRREFNLFGLDIAHTAPLSSNCLYGKLPYPYKRAVRVRSLWVLFSKKTRQACRLSDWLIVSP